MTTLNTTVLCRGLPPVTPDMMESEGGQMAGTSSILFEVSIAFYLM
jgi:hypothetical protein